jgi:hypothetical protein
METQRAFYEAKITELKQAHASEILALKNTNLQERQNLQEILQEKIETLEADRANFLETIGNLETQITALTTTVETQNQKISQQNFPPKNSNRDLNKTRLTDHISSLNTYLSDSNNSNNTDKLDCLLNNFENKMKVTLDNLKKKPYLDTAENKNDSVRKYLEQARLKYENSAKKMLISSPPRAEMATFDRNSEVSCRGPHGITQSDSKIDSYLLNSHERLDSLSQNSDKAEPARDGNSLPNVNSNLFQRNVDEYQIQNVDIQGLQTSLNKETHYSFHNKHVKQQVLPPQNSETLSVGNENMPLVITESNLATIANELESTDCKTDHQLIQSFFIQENTGELREKMICDGDIDSGLQQNPNKESVDMILDVRTSDQQVLNEPEPQNSHPNNLPPPRPPTLPVQSGRKL